MERFEDFYVGWVWGFNKSASFQAQVFAFSLTPLPNSWMICGVRRLCLCESRLMVDTRHEFQPSTNFFEPISRLTGELGSFMSSKRDLLIAALWTVMSFAESSTSLRNSRLSPMFITAKYFSAVPALSPISPSASFKSMRQSLWPVFSGET